MADAAAPPPPDLPKTFGPRPGALSLLTPPQRGLILAIMQAERCGRGGEDLGVLVGRFNTDTDAATQLNTRVNMCESWSAGVGSKAASPRR